MHANFGFIFEKLHQNVIVSQKSVSLFVENLLCDVNSRDCMFREFLNCKEQSIFKEYSADRQTFYYSWVTEKLTYRKIIDLDEGCNKMMPSYLKYCFTAEHQFQALQKIKDKLFAMSS